MRTDGQCRNIAGHALLVLWLSALSVQPVFAASQRRIKVIVDSDANNELDDQHAIAYALFNSDVFDVLGVTVNNTRNGGGIEGQYAEAQRVMKLCKAHGVIPLLKGAEGRYDRIVKNIKGKDFDGHAAVDFIIQKARAVEKEKLVLLPVGKLTNVALALAKAPDIVPKVRIVWLGGNYPDKGEYNLANDTSSVNPVIRSGAAFEMVTVRYNQPSGTSAVKASIRDIRRIMPGTGPRISEPVTGRHGGTFHTFGDYSINLFNHIKTDRAMYDMAAVAIVKNSKWGQVRVIPAPRLEGQGWVDQPKTPQTIKYWENFDKKAIMADFYETMKNPSLVKKLPG